MLKPKPKHVPQLLIKAPSPPLDPPTVRLWSYGLFVCPVRLFLLSCHLFTSGMFVVAIMIAPASFINRIHSASSSDRVVGRDNRPRVCNFPFTEVLSLVVNGTPRNGFRWNSSGVIKPRSSRSSIWAASASASSANGPSTTAFNSGLTCDGKVLIHSVVLGWTESI